MAGVRIAVYDSIITHYYGAGLYGVCSLGANVGDSTDDAHEYLLTAGHCTGDDHNNFAVFGPNYGAVLYQHDSATNPLPIATEVSNPGARTGIGDCPSGYTCKYSDAALFKYTSRSLGNFAYIARDSSYSSTLGVSGSLFRVDSFHVVNEIAESNWLVADTTAGSYDTFAHKVGRTTGWTYGPLISPCRTVYYSIGGNRALLCQKMVAAQSDLGDSGAPVFWWVCCNPNEAWFGGIVIMGAAGSDYIFSSIAGIRNDIPHLIIF